MDLRRPFVTAASAFLIALLLVPYFGLLRRYAPTEELKPAETRRVVRSLHELDRLLTNRE